MSNFSLRQHNAPLDEAMRAQGYKLISKQRGDGTFLRHYVDKEGNYVSYPPGYITFSGDYVSVMLENGTWAQRSTFPRKWTQDQLISWALEYAGDILKRLGRSRSTAVER